MNASGGGYTAGRQASLVALRLLNPAFSLTINQPSG